MNFDTSTQLPGYDVVVTPDLPKMQLSEGCPVTPAFRAEMNQWMLSFFGTTNTMPDGQVMTHGHTIYVNPRTRAMLKAI